jgi:2-polyprenyl-3-methyl-5-hydroxy-6-metoxy-1,4-benzoquinol methylase
MRKTDFLESQREYELEMISKINDRSGWKDVSVCPLCNSNKYTVEFCKYGIPLVRCQNCELRFHTKVPADPRDVYKDPAYLSYTKEDTDEHYNYRKERFGKERVRLLERYCGSLSGKKVLDVGCGNGYFLSVLKETGARCAGSEFSEKLRKYTVEKTGVPVYGESLEEFPDKDFDIITIFDVIEHIENPVPFISAALNLLKPGGHILIYTPNFDSFSIRVMKEYSSIVDPKEHLVLFSYKPIKYLGDALCLKIVHTETRGLDIYSILSYQSFLGERRNKFLVEWVNELQAMIDASGAGDYFRVIYKKGP